MRRILRFVVQNDDERHRQFQALTGQGRLLAVFALLTIGCTASTVSTSDPSLSRYAPANEMGVTGEISYCNAGAKSVRNARREDAYKKMHEACDGHYEIAREEDQEAPLCRAQRRIWFRCVG